MSWVHDDERNEPRRDPRYRRRIARDFDQGGSPANLEAEPRRQSYDLAAHLIASIFVAGFGANLALIEFTGQRVISDQFIERITTFLNLGETPEVLSSAVLKLEECWSQEGDAEEKGGGLVIGAQKRYSIDVDGPGADQVPPFSQVY